MTNKTERQIAEMKNQTIGVEVEMNSITRQAAAKLAAEYFGTGRWEDTARRNGYCTWSAWDAAGREWKFQKDVSIAGPDSEKTELVTPILRYEDIETLQELCRRLRKAGAKSDATRGCGVHIHIGANGHTPQTLRNLANIMASHEDLLADARASTAAACAATAGRSIPTSSASSTSANPRRWRPSRTSGTEATARTTAEASTTTTAGTTC